MLTRTRRSRQRHAAVNLAVKALLDANGFQSVGAARFFITASIPPPAARRRRHLPMDMGGIGKWSLTAAYNYNRTRIDRRLNNLGPLATIPGIVLFGRVEGIRFTDGQPRDKIVFSADGDLGDFGLTLRTTRYGKVIAPGATAPLAAPLSLTELGPDDIMLGAKWITDLELRYGGIRGLQLAIGADNVFTSIRTARPSVRARRRSRPVSDQPILFALFGLLALGFQRPLHLRPRLVPVFRPRTPPKGRGPSRPLSFVVRTIPQTGNFSPRASSGCRGT